MKRRDFLLGASAVAASAAVAPVALAASPRGPRKRFGINFANVRDCYYNCIDTAFGEAETQFVFKDGSSCVVRGVSAFEEYYGPGNSPREIGFYIPAPRNVIWSDNAELATFPKWAAERS